jgi:hypothetical protein
VGAGQGQVTHGLPVLCTTLSQSTQHQKKPALMEQMILGLQDSPGPLHSGPKTAFHLPVDLYISSNLYALYL